jgi:hypothetical protein
MAGIGALEILDPLSRRGTVSLVERVTLDILSSDAMRFLPAATRALWRTRLEDAVRPSAQNPLPQLRQHWPGTALCSGCGKAFRYLLMCSGCRAHMLCSTQCHKANWQQLRQACREERRRRLQQQQ